MTPYEEWHGILEVAKEDSTGKTQVLRLFARNPCKLVHSALSAEDPPGLSRQDSGQEVHRICRVYTISYGGGLVSGDMIKLKVTVHTNACLLLATQSSTKVYKSTPGRPGPNPADRPQIGATQILHASVENGGILVIAPEPVTCFARSSYTQHQVIRLEHATSNLLMVDWFTCGRTARGEKWDFDLYKSKNDVYMDGKLFLRDSVTLDASAASPSSSNGIFSIPSLMSFAGTTSSFDIGAVATVTVLGPSLAGLVQTILDGQVRQRIAPQLQTQQRTRSESESNVHVAASPISFEDALSRWSAAFGTDTERRAIRGAVLRIAGANIEEVREELQRQLKSLEAIVADDIWAGRGNG